MKNPSHVKSCTHSASKYRPDIDGIRAIAVLSVLGFHAFPLWLKGGFVGVDIFFVISGFLISTIIFASLAHDSFSFVEFYSRRIRRIFPALLLVLFVSFLIGWIALLADEYKQLGKHIGGGAGFISNFLFWYESGYFDNAADTKPLLHLWSLGIEEQFYIIWPLILWISWKRQLNIFYVTVAIAVVSFILNISTISGDTTAAFYSPQTRFWELLVGSIWAYLASPTHNLVPSIKNKINIWLGVNIFGATAEGNILRNICSFVGIIVIAFSLLVINPSKIFPGWWALLPTIGTVLIISAGQQAWLNRTILSNPVFVWFGLISFPLYLWHWPLLSFARIIQSETPVPEVRICAVILSIGFAWLTYRLIEKPIRFGNHGHSVTVGLLAAMFIVGFLGFNCYEQKGIPSRTVININPNLESGQDGHALGRFVNECGIKNIKDKEMFAMCFQDSRQTPRYALIGDSKAAALFPGLFRTSKENGRWLFIGGNGPNGAPVPVISRNEIYHAYQKLTNIAIDSIVNNQDIETVALVTATRVLFNLKNDYSIADLSTSKNYDAALEGLTKVTDKLIKAGKKIIIVVDNPTLPDPKDCLDRRTSSTFLNKILAKQSNQNCRLDLNRHIELSRKYKDMLLEVKYKNPEKIEIFDTIKYMCDIDHDLCLPYKNGRLLYSYGDHISDYASGLIGKGLNEFLSKEQRVAVFRDFDHP